MLNDLICIARFFESLSPLALNASHFLSNNADLLILLVIFCIIQGTHDEVIYSSGSLLHFYLLFLLSFGCL